MASFSDRFKHLLASLDITAKAMADKTSLPYRTLQSYLRGESEPNSDALGKISRLGVNLHWLLTGEGAMFVQERDALDFLVKEFKKYSDAGPPEPLSISAASFVDLYNSHGEDFSCFPEWLRRRIPKLEIREFQNLVANKGHKTDDAYSSGKTVTLPHNPLLATRISEALFKAYGDTYRSLDEKTRIRLYGMIYSNLCQMGVSETVEANMEDIETVLKLASKYGIVPPPVHEIVDWEPADEPALDNYWVNKLDELKKSLEVDSDTEIAAWLGIPRQVLQAARSGKEPLPLSAKKKIHARVGFFVTRDLLFKLLPSKIRNRLTEIDNAHANKLVRRAAEKETEPLKKAILELKKNGWTNDELVSIVDAILTGEDTEK